MTRLFHLSGSFVSGIGVEILTPADENSPLIYIQEAPELQEDVLVVSSDDLVDVKVRFLRPSTLLQALTVLYPNDESIIVNLEVNYWVSGELYAGLEWEDFKGTEGAPDVTIYAEPKHEGPPIVSLSEDGWYDVTTRFLHELDVLQILAQINGVPTSVVTLSQRRECLAC